MRGNQDGALNLKESEVWLKYAARSIDQRNAIAVKVEKPVTNFDSWPAVQSGEKLDIGPVLGNEWPRSWMNNLMINHVLSKNKRNLAMHFHYDELCQAYLCDHIKYLICPF